MVTAYAYEAEESRDAADGRTPYSAMREEWEAQADGEERAQQARADGVRRHPEPTGVCACHWCTCTLTDCPTCAEMEDRCG